MKTMKWIEGCGAVLLMTSLMWTTGCGGSGGDSGGGTTTVVTNTVPTPGSGTVTPSAASQLVAPQIVSPVNNQIFFVGSSEDINFQWTAVPGAEAYVFELDGTQHGGTVTWAKVNLGVGVHTCRVWGLVGGEPGPKSASVTFTLESLFAF